MSRGGLSDNCRSCLFQAYERHGVSGFDKEEIDLNLRRFVGSLNAAGYVKKHRNGKTYSVTASGQHYYRLMSQRGSE